MLRNADIGEKEAVLTEENSWDDSAILAIYNMALSSHQPRKFRGESDSGGLSRKQKKKAFKAALAEAQHNRAPITAEARALMEPKRVATWGNDGSLDRLNGPSKAFVEHFMRATETEPSLEVVEAWSEMCSAYAAYEAAADKYAIRLHKWEAGNPVEQSSAAAAVAVAVAAAPAPTPTPATVASSSPVSLQLPPSEPIITSLRDLESNLRNEHSCES